MCVVIDKMFDDVDTIRGGVCTTNDVPKRPVQRVVRQLDLCTHTCDGNSVTGFIGVLQV